MQARQSQGATQLPIQSSRPLVGLSKLFFKFDKPGVKQHAHLRLRLLGFLVSDDSLMFDRGDEAMVPRQRFIVWTVVVTNGPRSLTEFIKTGFFDAQC